MWSLTAFVCLMFVGLGVTVGWRAYEEIKPHPSRLYTAEYAELVSAQAEHDKILAIGGQCPPEGALKLDDRFTTIVPAGRSEYLPPPKPSGTASFATPGYLLAAIHLSTDIGRSRVDLTREQVFDDITMQVFAWVGVLVGALTTILISVRSMTREHMPMHFSLGVAAIVFSALGTSVAGLNSCYTPKIAYERTTRSLASLRQLHEQLASGITREQRDVVCQNWRTPWSNDWRYKRIKSLTDQYITVITAAQLGAPQPATDYGQGGATDNTDSPPQPQAAIKEALNVPRKQR